MNKSDTKDGILVRERISLQSTILFYVRKREKTKLKIDSATIGMESARSYRASSTTVRRFSITEYQASLAQSENTLNAAIANSEENTEEKSGETTEQTESLVEEWQNRYKISSSKVNIRSSESNTAMDIKQKTIRYIFDLLFAARRRQFYGQFEEESLSEEVVQSNTVKTSADTFADKEVAGLITTNFKVLNYSQEIIEMETESTYFSTVGTVRTSDGREINFNVEVGMSRSFQQVFRQDVALAAFQMCDPLVINLDTDVAELSDQKFFFDIDADGEEDEISGLGSKSGYLALDQNNDGKINDGSELFGTASGDGFADLEKYDEDGNGWIDENDAVWSKLQIWCKDEQGRDVLYRLADKGVGAICLQRAATDFTLQGGNGQTNGAIRSTGIFLYENGNVGTLQHVDVAKYDKEA